MRISVTIAIALLSICIQTGCEPGGTLGGDPAEIRAGAVSAGGVSAGDVLAGDVSAGDVSAGAVSAGEVSAGGVIAGDVLAGNVSAGPVYIDGGPTVPAAGLTLLTVSAGTPEELPGLVAAELAGACAGGLVSHPPAVVVQSPYNQFDPPVWAATVWVVCP